VATVKLGRLVRIPASELDRLIEMDSGRRSFAAEAVHEKPRRDSKPRRRKTAAAPTIGHQVPFSARFVFLPSEEWYRLIAAGFSDIRAREFEYSAICSSGPRCAEEVEGTEVLCELVIPPLGNPRITD